jgi:YidC/Oxa1 family membrane protein insertase
MDIRRVVLFAVLGFIGYSLWMDWQKDYPSIAPTSNTVINETAASPSDGQLLPDMKTEVTGTEQQSKAEINQSAQSNVIKPAKIVHVKTDVLDLKIDLAQGDIIDAQLNEFSESVADKKTPFTLLQNNPSERYVANSSLFTVQENVIKTLAMDYQAEKSDYQLPLTEKELIVTLKGHNADGLSVTKQFIFTRGSYLINMKYDLLNEGPSAWKGYMNTQLLRSSPKEDKSSMFHVGSYTGASYSSPGKHRYQKVSFKDMSKSNLDTNVEGGWIAMQQHYFLSAWIPESQSNNRFYTRATAIDFTIGSVSNPIEVLPSQQQMISSKLYIGPEVADVLKAISPGLDLTVDYGMLWFVSSMLFSLMTAIYSFVGNWGWSIVLVTVLIKLAFYKLSATSYKSMANMRRLQPKLLALKERYGDDKAKMSQATMEFYKQEKVNPLGGCLPIVIQIPVFIALYWVLIESVQLRQAPFIFWINDLAAADPYHVLPVIMGITMLIQQRLNPAPPDPMQAKIMMFLPVFFTMLFWGFPSGLVLYWIVNNTLSILQQWYITKKYGSDKPINKLITAK